MEDYLLEVRDLTITLNLKGGKSNVVENLSFHLARGETLGIVGESGCGKSMSSLAIMGLIPPQVGSLSPSSSVRFENTELNTLPARAMQNIRGNQIALILQDSMTTLNPVTSIEKQMVETLRAHRRIGKKEAFNLSVEMLKNVGIPSPEERIKDYPHQMSGGMKQRVNIAIALLCGPKLIIADEPTTALDVTIQAQILELFRNLKKSSHAALIMITHDLGVVSNMADTILVMYAGRVVEYAEARGLFKNPLHPYTRGLMSSIPRIGRTVDKLPVIPGQVASPEDRLEGCRFRPRCSLRTGKCGEEPPLYERDGQKVRCWIYE
jgi:peptide/nickel transport system ATP-binding protein/oligopeptide transport system ATP-binding protein